MKTARKLTIGFAALLLTGVMLIAGANLWKGELIVRRVTVAGNNVVMANEILQLAHIETGAKLYDLDLMRIQKDVLSHYFLKEVVVERDLPSTVRITVVERSPLAMISGGELRYLDPEGVVLPHSVSGELFDLPLISGIPSGLSTNVGSVLRHPDIEEALNILTTAKHVGNDLFHLVSEIRLRNGGDLVFYTAEAGIPILFGRGNAASKLVRLLTFWESVVRERGPSSLQYIDLRFEDQVVVRWKGEHLSRS